MIASPQRRLSDMLSALLPLHGLEAERAHIGETFHALTCGSLERLPLAARPRVSTLTRDGLPFELSLSLSRYGSGGLRYGTEAGALFGPLRERLKFGNRAVLGTLARVGAEEMGAVHHALQESLFRGPDRDRADVRFGIWVGAIHRSGKPTILKVYYNLALRAQEPVVLMQDLATALSTVVERDWIMGLPSLLPRGARLAYLGVEYGAGSAKVKLYGRPPAGQAITVQNVESLVARVGLGAQREFLATFYRLLSDAADGVAPRPLSLCVGQEQRAPVLGIYFAASPQSAGEERARRRIRSLLVSLGIDPVAYDATAEILLHRLENGTFVGSHTLIGLGLSPLGSKVNIYLQPTWEGLYALSGL